MAAMRAWAWGDRTKAACRRRGMADVVGVRAAAGDEPRRLGPHDRAADVAAVPGSGRRGCGARRRCGARHDRPARRGRRAATPLRRAQDGLDDGVIARAAAVVAAEGLADGRRIGMGLSREQLVRRQQHARRAEPALERVLRAEGVLQVGDRAALGEALDRLHAAAVGLGGEHQAAAHGRAVHAHGARAADAVLAAHVRAREPEVVAEEVDEVLARLDVSGHGRAVDGQRDLHEPSPPAGSTTRSEQHAGQMPAQRRAAVDVTGRIEVAVEGAAGRGQRDRRPRAGRPARPRRPGRERASCRRRRTRAAPRQPPRARGAHPRPGPRARSRRDGAPAPRTPSAMPAAARGTAIAVTISPGSSAVV